MDRKVFTRVTHLEQNHVHILKNGQVHFSYSPPSEDRLSNLIPTKYNMDTSLESPCRSTRLNYKQDEHINFGQVDVLHRHTRFPPLYHSKQHWNTVVGGLPWNPRSYIYTTLKYIK
jgi:hypothetical protein